jgi:tRNA(Ile)-lysidine synthetase-like protein
MLNSITEANARRAWSLERQQTLLTVSGGKDSMVLFHAFATLGYPFGVAHVNFGLRGEESDADELFVQRACEKENIPFHSLQAHGIKKLRGESTQMWARRVRYEFFEKLCESESYDWVATAHHAGDNLEHFLIYLYRNQDDIAWRGIKEQNVRIIRPLLRVSPKDLETYRTENQIQWREDSSNQSSDYLRNMIRNNILSEIHEYPQLVHLFSSVSMGVAEIETKKLKLADARWPSEDLHFTAWIIEQSSYSRWRSTIRPKLLKLGFFPSQIKQALREKRAKTGALWETKNGSYRMVKGRNEQVHIFRSTKSIYVPLFLGQQVSINGWDIELKRQNDCLSDEDVLLPVSEEMMDGGKLSNQWQGKRLKLVRGETQKLSDYITNNKWSPEEKEYILMVEKYDEVLSVGSVLKVKDEVVSEYVIVRRKSKSLIQ